MCEVLQEATLGMHAWKPAAAQGSAAGARRGGRSAEEQALRRQRLVESFCAKSPVYENCRMLSLDGEPLSFIDLRKLQWYEVRASPSSLW
jgi:cation-transporting P-type ATPase D